jgi:hypothetical protein
MATYKKITEATISSTVNSITISSIPNIYSSLKLIFAGKINSADNTMYIRTNSSSSATYRWTRLRTVNTGTEMFQQSGATEAYIYDGAGSNAISNNFVPCEILLMNNTAAAGARSGMVKAGVPVYTGTQSTMLSSLTFPSGAGITIITMYGYSGDFISGTRYQLYGLS